MKLGLVVSTLGRVDGLTKLYLSIKDQLLEDDCLVIVAQQNQLAVEMLVNGWDARFNILFATSERGLSLGRNLGASKISGKVDYLLFPNDTCWFSPGSIAKLRQLDQLPKIAAQTVIDSSGPRFIIPEPNETLTPANVWKALEAGLIIQSELFFDLGGFNTSFGSGASTPWQAGEGTDLLLRYLNSTAFTSFGWLPKEHYVNTVPESFLLSNHQRKIKIRAYGRGIGRVRSAWGYSTLSNFKFLIGGLLIGVKHRESFTITDGLWALTGRFEGLIGKTLFNDNKFLAVTR